MDSTVSNFVRFEDIPFVIKKERRNDNTAGNKSIFKPIISEIKFAVPRFHFHTDISMNEVLPS